MKSAFIALFVFSFVSSLQSANNHLFVHPNLPEDVKTANRLDRLSSSRVLHLTVSLPGRNLDEMNSLAQVVYDRHNAQNHHYLTPAQVADEFGPTPGEYQKLQDFLKANNLHIDNTFAGRVCVCVTGRVDEIENVFNVHLYNYQRPDGTQFYAPDAEPSVSLEVPIEHVSGLDNAHPPKPAGSRPVSKPLALSGSGTSGAYFGKDIT
ncbi:MAG TPA: protease pro-enzyme activation domain-containing protein, partial [bacterium]|nr:protease pro-enzyme activation domain-containing protein [bacterium]